MEDKWNAKTTKWNAREWDGTEDKTDARCTAYLSPTMCVPSHRQRPMMASFHYHFINKHQWKPERELSNEFIHHRRRHQKSEPGTQTTPRHAPRNQNLSKKTTPHNLYTHTYASSPRLSLINFSIGLDPTPVVLAALILPLAFPGPRFRPDPQPCTSPRASTYKHPR